jgi:phospholipid/cholesterol/gamma-HCH transport system permease protein
MTENARNLEVTGNPGQARLKLSGRLDAGTVAGIWNEALAAAGKGSTVDASGVDYCDGTGVALLWELQRKGATVSGQNEDTARLLEVFAKASREEKPNAAAQCSPIEWLGRTAVDLGSDFREQITFLGQMTVTYLAMLKNPRGMRWADMWLTFEKAGVQALVVVSLISFLTGLIMAFQAAPPLEQFGVDLFVVNLVALAMLRELGPLMTAIVLAGRSGSAFAAEIGTMKVNEEINALTTMGIDPMRFLAAPRVLAGILLTPVLTVYSDLMGVGGGLFVMLLRGFPPITLWHQLTGAVAVNDVMAGIIKAFVFGALVAGIGCLRGLQTKSGAMAVGESTTRSVVSGIFFIVVVDAIFAVVYYAIGF